MLPLLTAFGLGSIVTALVQASMAHRSKQDDRSFREKQAAYIGLLEPYHRAAIEGNREAAKNFAYWQMRCELVAPAAVRMAITKIIDTNEDPIVRAAAHDNLNAEFRKDLGVTK